MYKSLRLKIAIVIAISIGLYVGIDTNSILQGIFIGSLYVVIVFYIRRTIHDFKNINTKD